jgi:hypothetical protein
MSGLPEENQLRESPNAISLVLPASLTAVPQFSRQDVMDVETARFEPGSQITRPDTDTFGHFSSLLSICIPTSVEFLGVNCFISSESDVNSAISPLVNLTFERGSKLREIAPNALSGCFDLSEFCIPASVEKLKGLSLPPARLCVVEVESGNIYFHRAGDFIMSSNERCLVRYFGNDSEVKIGDEIETIDDGCFLRSVIAVVRFGPESKLSSIGVDAFFYCARLKMIALPSSVTVLGNSCFQACESLATVAFCAGSKLETIPEAAFTICLGLTSIILPPSAKTIGDNSFAYCWRLETWPIPVDSELIRIGASAFCDCYRLRSMFLPSTVEVVGRDCFVRCNLVSSLTFEVPSHLRELLSLPSGLTGFVAIPDSVEILAFVLTLQSRGRCILTFGSESRLVDLGASVAGHKHDGSAFLRVSSRSLKNFRLNWEFTRSS